MNKLYYSLLWIGTLLFCGCSFDGLLEELSVSFRGKLKFKNEKSSGSPTCTVVNDRFCQQEVITEYKTVDELVLTEDNQDAFPGNIILLPDLYDGAQLTLNPVGSEYERLPVIISQNGLSIDPELSSILSFRERRRDSLFQRVSPARLDISSYSSFEEASTAIGVGLNMLGQGVKNNIGFSFSSDEVHLFIIYTQVAYSITVDYFDNPEFYFKRNVRDDVRRALKKSGNAWGLVREVSYGRMMVARLSYKTTNQVVASNFVLELNGLLNGVPASIGATMSSDLKAAISTSEMKIHQLGGRNVNFSIDPIDNLTKIANWIQDDNWDGSEKPIKCKIGYIDTDEYAKYQLEITDTIRQCVLLPKQVAIKSLEILSYETDPRKDLVGEADVFFKLGNFYIESNNQSKRPPIKWAYDSAIFVPNWRDVPLIIGVWDEDTEYNPVDQDDFLGEIIIDLGKYAIDPDSLPACQDFYLIPSLSERLTECGKDDDLNEALCIRLELEWR